LSFIGLDAGTTGIKAYAYDDRGTVLASSYKEYRLITPRDGWSELDPQEILEAADTVLREIAGRLPAERHYIAAASCAQAFVPLDEEGRPLYRFITTIDTRTYREDEWWRKNADEERIFRKTGLPFSPIYTANKLIWLRDNEPDAFRRARRFFLVQDFLTWHLSGEALIDRSLASRGMMLDIHRCEWDEEILGIIGVRKEQFSVPVRAGTVVGRIRSAAAEKTGLPADTMIVVGSHDQICGTIGCGAVKKGMTTDAAGTIEVLLPITDGIPDMHGLIRYHFPCIPHVLDGRYAVMSINQNSGVLLKWYRDLVSAGSAEKISYRELIEESVDHVADLYVLPHLNGCETPISDPLSSAAFVRMRMHHTRADLTRAVLDGIAYDLREQVGAFEKIGIPIGEIRAIGGGARTDKLLQIKADCTRRVIRTTKVTEAASLGAAILAAVGSGVYADPGQAAERMVQPDKTFCPRENVSREYDEGFAVFSDLYDALKGINHR